MPLSGLAPDPSDPFNQPVSLKKVLQLNEVGGSLKPQSQQTMKSGTTLNRPAGLANSSLLNYDSASKDVIPLIKSGPNRDRVQIGLTSHNLDMLNQNRPQAEQGKTRQNFLNSFLNQIDSTVRLLPD